MINIKTSSNGIKFIEVHEGGKGKDGLFKAYHNKGEKYYTIGYGHYGPDVKKGKIISESEAQDLLKKDLTKYEAGVNSSVTIKLGQNQFDALVSFAYNLGVGALKNSTLLKRINEKDYKRVSTEWVRWCHSNHKVIKGLLKRRKEELAMFKKDLTSDEVKASASKSPSKENQIKITNNASTNKVSTAKYQIKVTANALNIRKGPGIGYTVVGCIRDKGIYTIVQECNGWGKLADNRGWIKLSYTIKNSAKMNLSTNYQVKVTANALNIRKGPGTGYTVVGCIRDKGTYTIVQECNGWGKLADNRGWIKLSYTIKNSAKMNLSKNYQVKVTANALNTRKGSGTGNKGKGTSKLTGIELVKHCKSKIGTPYVFGAKGANGKLTQSFLNSLIKSYPKMFTPIYIKKAEKLVGKVCTDCSGLISWYTGKNIGTDAMNSTATKRGLIKDIRKAPIGAVLWKNGHVGVYIGNGYCIEAKGIDYGTIKSSISNTRFTHWLLFENLLSYDM